MPTVCSVMKPESSIITLIKPQFEARRSQVFICGCALLGISLTHDSCALCNWHMVFRVHWMNRVSHWAWTTIFWPRFDILTLIASTAQVGGGGIVRDPAVHKEVRWTSPCTWLNTVGAWTVLVSVWVRTTHQILYHVCFFVLCLSSDRHPVILEH